MAKLVAFSTGVQDRESVIDTAGNVVFTPGPSEGPPENRTVLTSNEIIQAQVVSEHDLDLFVVSVTPIMGPPQARLTLNRELHRGVDPFYPDPETGEPSEEQGLYAELHVTIVAPGGVYEI